MHDLNFTAFASTFVQIFNKTLFIKSLLVKYKLYNSLFSVEPMWHSL